MDKKKIRYFYFDMDGTLLRDDKALASRSVWALKKLMAGGFKVGFVSGRPDYMMKKELALVRPNLPVIAINGAKITHNDKIMHFSLIAPDVCQQITAFLVTNGVPFLGYGKKGMYYFLPRGQKSQWISWLLKTKSDRPRAHKWDLKPFNRLKTRFAKILVVTSETSETKASKVKTFIAQFSSVYGVSSQASVLDIMPCGVSKGTGLKLLAARRLINLHQTIVFGDGHNDIPMFKVAKFSVAMQNAYEVVKEAARMISQYNNNDDGVAEFIKREIFNGAHNN